MNKTTDSKHVLDIRELSIAYEPGHYAVNDVSASTKRNSITTIMGPAGCGKSTLLRAMNRMHELYPNMTTYENVVAGFSLNDIRMKKSQRDDIVEEALRNVAFWDEVKESLFRKGRFLSGGQQQRLCVARAIAFNPEILLLDEPTSALDPVATSKIEDLLGELKKKYTLVLVTHNMSQAARISDDSMFMYMGELAESGSTEILFTNPKDSRTEAYLTGKFG